MARTSMPPRRRRHLVVNSAVVAYLAAAVVVAAVPRVAPHPHWLALHLLLLGAATNAILVWSAHFTDGMLQLRSRPITGSVVRLVAANAGILAVLVGVAGEHPALTVAGAVVLGAAVLGHAGRFAVHAVRRRPRLGAVVWFYVAAAVALAAAAVIGALISTGVSDREHVHAAHAHLALLGWIGLTVVGTEFLLWPAVLRTQMPDPDLAVAPWVLAGCAAGLTVASVSLLADVEPAAAAGVALYTAGVALALVPFVRTVRTRTAFGASAAWGIAAGTGWFVVGLVIDVVGLLAGDGDEALDRVVPLLALGFVAQVLVWSLAFLLPNVLGGGPRGNRRLAALLQSGWRARLVLTNVGVLLFAVPGPHALHVAGVALAIAGLAAFLPLGSAALWGATREDSGT